MVGGYAVSLRATIEEHGAKDCLTCSLTRYALARDSRASLPNIDQRSRRSENCSPPLWLVSRASVSEFTQPHPLIMYILGRKLQRVISLDPTNFGVTGARNLVLGTACANDEAHAQQRCCGWKHTARVYHQAYRPTNNHVLQVRSIACASTYGCIRAAHATSRSLASQCFSRDMVRQDDLFGRLSGSPAVTHGLVSSVHLIDRVPTAIQPVSVIRDGYRVTLDCRKECRMALWGDPQPLNAPKESC